MGLSKEGQKDLSARGGRSLLASPVHLLWLLSRCSSGCCSRDSLLHLQTAGTPLLQLRQASTDPSALPLQTSLPEGKNWGIPGCGSQASPINTYVFDFELDTPPPADELLCATLDGQHLCAERVSFQGPAHLTWDLCATTSLASCGWLPYLRSVTIAGT